MTPSAATPQDGFIFNRPYLYPKQKAAIYEPKRFSLIEASTKAGKAQPLNALVYTPTGPKRMGDIREGDAILTPTGQSRVVGVYPQGRREVIRVTFSDGQVVEADADHLWEVHGFRRGPVIATTEDLQKWPTWKFRKAWVPDIKPAHFAHQPVPIDPYLLGVLIGDGGMSQSSVKLSNADDEIINAVRDVLPDGHELVYEGRCDWRVTAGSGAAQLREDGTHLRGVLERMGLGGKGSHDKFVPDAYRYNTEDVRRSVLQGILDTDGFVDKHGQPGIEQTSERLARDITELVQSLGGSVLTRLRPVNGYRAKDGRFVQCRPVWRQVIRVPDGREMFRLERKRSACRPKRKTGHRMFRSIEFARYDEAQCIQIADKRALYLTDGFIPTHNTVSCIVWLTEEAFAGRDGWNYWWVAPVSAQANIAFTRMRRSLGEDCRAYMNPPRIVLPNGAIIWFKSADKPDSLYGDDVHALVIDEASRVKRDAWHALRSVITATGGPARIIGNVKGRKNWFYELARKAEQGHPRMAFHKMTAIDAIEAGVLPEDEVRDAKEVLPEHVFNELYMAEAADDGGNPFGLANIQACTVDAMHEAPADVYGVDLAKSVDWTVVIGMTRLGHVVSLARWQHVPWEETIARILRIIGNKPTLVDSTGVGDPILELLQRRTDGYVGEDMAQVQGYHFTPRSKQQLMEGLAASLQSHGLVIPKGPITVELEEFEYRYRGKDGTMTGVTYSAPPGFHDDCVMALALADIHRLRAPKGLHIPDSVIQAVQMYGAGQRW